VAVGAILLLAVIVALAYRVGLFSFGTGEPAGEQPVYQVHLPADYSPERRWPVFVGIHGFGGSMQDCWDIWHAYIDQAGFILVCPGLADEGGGWYQDEGERALRSLLNEVRREYNVEPQVFLAGFSAGGQFAQGFAFNHPDQVYAVSVLSAGNYYEPTAEAAHIPFQVIIGERDNPQALQNATAFRNLLEQYGYEYEFHILPDAGHQVTDAVKELTIEFFRRVSGSEDD
jgi:predicted esterase